MSFRHLADDLTRAASTAGDMQDRIELLERRRDELINACDPLFRQVEEFKGWDGSDWPAALDSMRLIAAGIEKAVSQAEATR